MPLRVIDVGAQPDDGSGDSVRDAFEKANYNFDLLVDAIFARLTTHAAYAPLRHTHEDAAMRVVADVPPKDPPRRLGTVWINASDGRAYLACGTAIIEDWREIAFIDPP